MIKIILVISLFSTAFSEGALTVIMIDDQSSKFVNFTIPETPQEKGENPLYVTKDYHFYIVDSSGTNISEGRFYLPHKKLCFESLKNCINYPENRPNIDSLFVCCGKDIAMARIPNGIKTPNFVSFIDKKNDSDPPDYMPLAFIYILDIKDNIFLDLLEKKGVKVCRKDCYKECAKTACFVRKDVPSMVYDTLFRDTSSSFERILKRRTYTPKTPLQPYMPRPPVRTVK